MDMMRCPCQGCNGIEDSPDTPLDKKASSWMETGSSVVCLTLLVALTTEEMKLLGTWYGRDGDVAQSYEAREFVEKVLYDNIRALMPSTPKVKVRRHD